MCREQIAVFLFTPSSIRWSGCLLDNCWTKGAEVQPERRWGSVGKSRLWSEERDCGKCSRDSQAQYVEHHLELLKLMLPFRILCGRRIHGQGSTACLFSPEPRTHVHGIRSYIIAKVCEQMAPSDPSSPLCRYRSLSIDESGDYIDWTIKDNIVHKCELGTLFGQRRRTLYQDKVLDILRDKKKLPAQPQPVQMGPATLLGQMYTYVGGQGTTGAQIDTLRKYNHQPLTTLIDDLWFSWWVRSADG